MASLLPTQCDLCPRVCGADRAAGERGVCGADATLRVARAALHHWEEPPISGTRGSGTVFFSHCSLCCSYCQNAPISRGAVGKAISVARLAELFWGLQGQGAHNINLVTPTHYVPQITAALDKARAYRPEPQGSHPTSDKPNTLVRQCESPREARQSSPQAERLTIPVVYNTSGYECVDTLRQLEGYVDIYLTDFKYASSELAAHLSQAADYPAAALLALLAMVEQVGEYALDSTGILERGVIVRHLLLPGHIDDAKHVLERVFNAVGNQVCYSLMSQYTPRVRQTGTLLAPQADTPRVSQVDTARASQSPELQRTVTEEEYSELVDFALDLGITNSFMQEGSAAAESFIPPFDLTGV